MLLTALVPETSVSTNSTIWAWEYCNVRQGKNQGLELPHKKPTDVKVLLTIRDLFDFQCGKLLTPLIGGMIDFQVH